MSAILPIQGIPLPDIRPAIGPAAGSGQFQNALETAVKHVEQSRADASQAVSQFLSGQNEELHSAALATQRAELSAELFLQVRNKIVQAYQEIMRMQM